jgi:hypothetical protein
MSVGVGAASICWFCCRKPSVCQAKNPAASNSGVSFEDPVRILKRCVNAQEPRLGSGRPGEPVYPDQYLHGTYGTSFHTRLAAYSPMSAGFYGEAKITDQVWGTLCLLVVPRHKLSPGEA